MKKYFTALFVAVMSILLMTSCTQKPDKSTPPVLPIVPNSMHIEPESTLLETDPTPLETDPTPPSEPELTPSEPDITPIRAIYLVLQGGGQLTTQEIEACPGILVVNTFSDLKEAFQTECAIWIDKNAITMIDETWLHEESQMYCPVVLVGYNDAIYSFRDQLSGFGIEGPYVDWSKEKLEPGFSVWMLLEKTKTSTSAYMKGYDEVPSAKQIIALTDSLLERNITTITD